MEDIEFARLSHCAFSETEQNHRSLRANETERHRGQYLSVPLILTG